MANLAVILSERHDIVRRIEETAPDVIIIDIENPNREMVGTLAAHGARRKPGQPTGLQRLQALKPAASALAMLA